MSADLATFHEEFAQKLHREADAEGRFLEDAFFELFCDHLVEAGELESFDRAHYQGRGIRVDGYGGDPAYSEGVLTLIVADYDQSHTVATLTATDMDTAFNRAATFVKKSLDSTFRRSLEETSPGFGLADLIGNSWSSVHKVRLLLISNRVLSTRVDGRSAAELEGKPVVYSVWDLSRLERYSSSGRSREEIVVTMEEHGGPVAALPAHLTDAGYEAYLLVIPGQQLASIYGRWGARLLEQNVRVFLQAKGGVNKGIRNTLENDPEMFFAYNNGITATAEAVYSEDKKGALSVTALRNLQIVNGGQTTASIYAASTKKADLSKVFVQMKLSVIPPDRAEEVVPKISEFANSQNRVNAADFFANHPFHLKIKEFSQRVFAPSPDGAFRESKWFYERARGQYQDARSGLSGSAVKKFELEFPKNQVFSKTDLAKFLNSWEGHPEIVSRGAQKNFAHFAGNIGSSWERNPDVFNEVYFRHLVAKAIVFRATEELVTRQAWYEGGYRANIVAYAVAKLANDVKEEGKSVNLDVVWRLQRISPRMHDALALVAKNVNDVLINPPSGVKNVTEWAKQSACWTRAQKLSVAWPKPWREELLTRDEQRQVEQDGIKGQKILNGIEAQLAVVAAGPEFWREVKTWAVENKVLSQKELEIIEVAAGMPLRLPNEKQCPIIMTAFATLRKEGFPLSLPPSAT